MHDGWKGMQEHANFKLANERCLATTLYPNNTKMDAPSSSLCPGYKEVNAFGPDEFYEDEEVCYVTLDLGSVEPTLLPNTSTYRLIVSKLNCSSHTYILTRGNHSKSRV